MRTAWWLLRDHSVQRGDSRGSAVQRALWLEYGTVGWNVVEGLVAVAAAIASGSIALLGFGVDSFVETLSGGILIWRLRAEAGLADQAAIARLDQRAHRLVGLSLFALAAYIAIEAGRSLLGGERPGATWIGIAVTSISIGVMWWLAREKRRSAGVLGSRALKADAFQTTACWWLSLITLSGVGLNTLIGWWWADPVAALAICVPIVYEGREAWRGEDSCADGCEHDVSGSHP